jgi:hypothetical protein
MPMTRTCCILPCESLQKSVEFDLAGSTWQEPCRM